jgi:hypothetical protein
MISWDGLEYTKDPVTGEIVYEKKKVLESVTDHFEKIYCPPKATRTLREGSLLDMDEVYRPLESIDPSSWTSLMKSTTILEISEIIKNLPNGKSAGVDGLPYETFKLLFNLDSPEATINLKALTELINTSLKTGIFPFSASQGEVILLPKIHDWTDNTFVYF